jgi:phage terminase large subunit-like protein
MSDSECELFRSVADRDPPRKRVRELWIVGGRRGGKDSIASLIATWFSAFVDYRALLRPGEAASVLRLACDRSQAKRAYFAQNTMLGHLVTGETADGLTLSTGAELMVATNSFRSVRGRTIACVVLDEIAYWRDERSATPDVETYNAIVPGLATLPDALVVGISSPYRRSGRPARAAHRIPRRDSCR